MCGALCSAMASATTQASDSPDLWWVGPLVGISTVVLGSGGIVAYRRLRLDRKLGVAAADLAEDEHVTGHLEKIIEAQTASLIDPLRVRLAEVTAEVRNCEEEQRKLEAQMTADRRKYQRAIGYVRTLLTWIRARTQIKDEPPPAPVEITEDI